MHSFTALLSLHCVGCIVYMIQGEIFCLVNVANSITGNILEVHDDLSFPSPSGVAFCFCINLRLEYGWREREREMFLGNLGESLDDVEQLLLVELN